VVLAVVLVVEPAAADVAELAVEDLDQAAQRRASQSKLLEKGSTRFP
jgi:hypothetical protein